MNHNRGMTLLEVMVALAVLSIAGLAVMKTASENLTSLLILEEKTFGLWVAENQLAELRLGAISAQSEQQRVERTMADRSWYCQTKTNETSYEGLAVVQVNVMRDETSQAVLASVISYMRK